MSLFMISGINFNFVIYNKEYFSISKVADGMKPAG